MRGFEQGEEFVVGDFGVFVKGAGRPAFKEDGVDGVSGYARIVWGGWQDSIFSWDAYLGGAGRRCKERAE